VDQLYDRVAGLDVHRDNVVGCFRRRGPRGGVAREKERFTTTTAGLRVLEAWLAERQVELVAMEATGVYSRFTVWLCNARAVKKQATTQDPCGLRNLPCRHPPGANALTA
jgi:transposase